MGNKYSSEIRFTNRGDIGNPLASHVTVLKMGDDYDFNSPRKNLYQYWLKGQETPLSGFGHVNHGPDITTQQVLDWYGLENLTVIFSGSKEDFSSKPERQATPKNSRRRRARWSEGHYKF